jgi:putative chitinase
MITPELVETVTGDAVTWHAALRDACELHEIDTEDRVAIFLAQCAHESDGFQRLEENLHYSAQRLLAVFPKYFADQATANKYGGRPEMIADRVYADRMGNGPEGSGDGWLYRGRGLIQLTGRHNYRRCGDALGAALVDEPELLLSPLYAALSAAWFWRDRGCNALADAGHFNGVTKRINGGLNGLDDRLAWLDKVRGAMA